jgi:hypothetical protein
MASVAAPPVAAAEGGDVTDIHSQAKADLASALAEMSSAKDPQAKADAFLAALDLADECRSYAPEAPDALGEA